jgi:hypothetical protein
MTQEATTTGQSAETRKKILLGILFLLLFVVVYYQFFGGGSSSPSTPPAGGATVTPGSPGRTSGAATTAARPPARSAASQSPLVSQPLDLLSMVNKVAGDSGSGRNIFVYPTPTPPPPPPTPKPVPPPPPPPVSIISLSPSGVIARTGEFNLTIFGDKIPADGQIQIGGRPFKTQFVSATEARTQVPAEVIQVAGNLSVTVRSQADPALFSNQISINVAEPPTPLYRYIGLIITKQRKLAVLKEMDGEENLINMVENQAFGKGSKKKWKILSITPQKLIIEDLELKLTHSVGFTGETGSAGS